MRTRVPAAIQVVAADVPCGRTRPEEARGTGDAMVARALIALIVLAVPAGSVHAQSGLQLTPDGKRTLISKDVGAERWAITLNDEGGIITGNVFESAGGAPKFIECRQERVQDGQVFLACRGADPCVTGPCTPANWTTIPGEIVLPLSFFHPPAAAAAEAAAAGTGTAAEGGRESGIQITPDQSQVLVSKDVGGQRWAITRHADDHTVTGNVFSGTGSPPQFV